MSEIPNLPDWPILKHLTWREAHLFELGVWPGFGVAVALTAMDYGAVLALVSVIRRKMQRKDQRKDSDDAVSGFLRDGWYFAMGAIVGFVIGFGAITVSKLV